LLATVDRWTNIAAWWSGPRAQAMIRWVALASFLASTTATTFYWMQREVSPKVLKTFNYGEKRFAKYRSVRREWRPRIGSTLLVRSFHSEDPPVMRDRVAWFFALAVLVCGVVYLGIDARAGPFMAVATFASLVYASSPRAENIWMPWDMPALVFSALALLCARRQWPLALAAVIVVGVPFKETVLVMAVLFWSFSGWSVPLRLASAAGTFAVGYAVRLAIELVIRNPMGPNAFSYHVKANPDNQLRLAENLSYLFSLDGNHLAWANAGTLLVVFLLPAREPVLRSFKLAAAVLYAGMFVMGSVNEFRIFFEALPGALLLLFYALMPAPPSRAVA
jgi:hypothetical protein